MRKAPDTVREEAAVLTAQQADDIDFTDIPPTTLADWDGAVRGKFYKPAKKQLTVRIDADVLEWLKRDGEKGYQKRLNSILRTAMLGASSQTPEP